MGSRMLVEVADNMATFSCKNKGGTLVKSMVDLDQYIGIEVQEVGNGEIDGVLVYTLSCSTTTVNLGVYENCQADGTTHFAC